MTRRGFSSLLAARDGVAATEFAFIAPVMILIFFLVVEGSNALAASRRASLAANALADLASQEQRLSPDQAEDLFEGVRQIIGADEGVGFALVSLVIDPDTENVVVAWSRDAGGGAPYAPGAAYSGLADAALLDGSTALMVAEISYAYAPPIAKFLAPTIEIDKVATRWPRRSARVLFCQSPSNCVG